MSVRCGEQLFMHTVELLNNGLKELGIPCSDDQINSFMTYLSELKKWNRAYNLTGLKTDEDIVIKHFLDSLIYLRAIPEGKLKLADAGTGAGFPGIPLKIVRPEMEVTLIESSRKKTAFLRHVIRLLKLKGIEVLDQRLERLGKGYEKSFDVMASRAAFSISDFLSMACPYLKAGGLLVLNKGPRVSEELKEIGGSRSADNVKAVLKLKLPITNDERNLVVLGCGD